MEALGLSAAAGVTRRQLLVGFWPRLLPLAAEAGIIDFFVDQEPPFTVDRFEALRISQAYLAGL